MNLARNPNPGKHRTLESLRLLDGESDLALTEFAELARMTSGCPIAMVSFLDESRVFTRACVGIASREDPAEHSLCAQAIHAAETVVFDDLRAHPWFRDTPLVLEAPRARFFAGAPIVLDTGEVIGALSVIHPSRHTLENWQLASLEKLAAQVGRTLDARRIQYLLQDQQPKISEMAVRLDLAQAIAGQSLWDWDLANGRFADSHSLAALLGLSPAQLGDDVEAWISMTHPDDVQGFTSALSKHLRGETGTLNIEVRQRHSDGNWIWLRVRGRVVERDERGMPLRMLGTVVDISDRRMIEEQVRQLNHQLEQQAREASDRARYRSQFLATMAHEIRTPLNGILGSAQLALMAVESPAQRRHLELMMETSVYLGELVNDVLDHSRLDAGALEIEARPVSPRKILQEVASRFHFQAMRTGLRLETIVAPQVPETILGDSLRLQQVLTNLVGNALKFTPQGTVSALMEVVTTSDGSEALQTSVKDTGIGISGEMQQALFSPYAQGGASIARQHGGSGLGLAISKRLVHLMGGQIHLASELGRGTTITFSIPIHQPLTAPAQMADAPPAQSRAHEPDLVGRVEALGRQLKGRRVLVIDDNPLNLRVVGLTLQRAGLESMVAASGTEGLSMVLEHSPDAVLLDVHMPDLDGIQVCRRIRDHLGEDAPLVLALSAAVTEEDRAQCLAAGMVGFLSKPIAPVAILEALAQHLATD